MTCLQHFYLPRQNTWWTQRLKTSLLRQHRINLCVPDQVMYRAFSFIDP
jgi:hypothetical protein